ncbi:hypothetical protein PQU94_06425 [Asticcacaulis sp. DXS10W]|uniref:EF-hand domain-containing protein n=1 Tax=Asticcacaulis currens TaxID=2984210 RepID=A0ABT5ICL0_9CAUL|nr:hypothetical protein [Asticcacaulis currens]MDC7693916.1 hypothetical protein [Asticcacaulis currens]
MRPIALSLMAAGLMMAATPVFAQATLWQERMQEHRKRADEMREKFEERLFKRADSNQDNFISREEFLKQANERFDRLDVNKDGKLSREEVRAELKGPKRPPEPKDK